MKFIASISLAIYFHALEAMSNRQQLKEIENYWKQNTQRNLMSLYFVNMAINMHNLHNVRK